MPGRYRLILFLAAALTSVAISTFAADSAQTAADVERAQKSGEILPQEEIIHISASIRGSGRGQEAFLHPR